MLAANCARSFTHRGNPRHLGDGGDRRAAGRVVQQRALAEEVASGECGGGWKRVGGRALKRSHTAGGIEGFSSG